MFVRLRQCGSAAAGDERGSDSAAKRGEHAGESHRGFRRNGAGGADSTSSRSLTCQSGNPRWARSARISSFSRVPGMASAAANFVYSTSGGSKSQIPILIASSTDFGTIKLLLRSDMEISWSKWLSIYFLAKKSSKCDSFVIMLRSPIVGEFSQSPACSPASRNLPHWRRPALDFLFPISSLSQSVLLPREPAA
jgi:hypothetical protein